MKNVIKLFSGSVLAVLLTGCMATQTALNNHNLEVHSKLNDSIFLDPVPVSQKTVYVETRNSSNEQSLNIKSYLMSDLQQKGYQIVNNPNKAHYLLQVDVLKVAKSRPNKDKMASDGTLSGGALGASVGALSATASHDFDEHVATDAAIGAVVGAVAGNVANAAIKDVIYVVNTEVQVSERSNANTHVSNTSHLQQGSSSTETMTSQGNSGWMKYRTSATTTAEKMNLKFEEASPYISQDLAKTISNIFA